METKVEIYNALGVKYEVSTETLDDISSAEFIIEKPFKECELSPEDYINEVYKIVGDPRYPEIGKEGIVLGWLLFNGVRKFGVGYLEKLLKEEDAEKSIIYMLVAQSEALTNVETNDGIITSGSNLEKGDS